MESNSNPVPNSNLNPRINFNPNPDINIMAFVITKYSKRSKRSMRSKRSCSIYRYIGPKKLEMSSALVKHAGGCHCGAVRFEVLAAATIYSIDCNCTICYMKANAHFIVPAANFKLVKGENLTTYTFNTHTAKHMFCKTCGVQSFYIPRSNPDGYGINPRCIDKGTIEKIIWESYDGKHWEDSMEKEKQKVDSITNRSK